MHITIPGFLTGYDHYIIIIWNILENLLIIDGKKYAQ